MKTLRNLVLVGVVLLGGCGLPLAAVALIAAAGLTGGATAIDYYVAAVSTPSPTPTPLPTATLEASPLATPAPIATP